MDGSLFPNRWQSISGESGESSGFPEDDELAQEGRDWFKRLEDGDQDARQLWTRFRDESLSEFDRIYDRTGVQFEHTWGEAYYDIIDQVG